MTNLSGNVTPRGLGLAAGMPEQIIVKAAEQAETGGYNSFWVNNPPGANALATLSKAAGATRAIDLGVGVIPLGVNQPEHIVRQVRELDLPLDRFYLGIGSGSGPGGLARVARGTREIRSQLDCKLVIAALGPRMCSLAATVADGVLLNWLTPEYAQTSVEWIHGAAREAGAEVPRVMAYVRVALGDAAIERLRHEAANYEAIKQYASHFKRMGASAFETAITGTTPDEIQRGLSQWQWVVDEVIVRAIPAADAESDVLAVLEAAKPGA